jgi:hypothetical protein
MLTTSFFEVSARISYPIRADIKGVECSPLSTSSFSWKQAERFYAYLSWPWHCREHYGLYMKDELVNRSQHRRSRFLLHRCSVLLERLRMETLGVILVSSSERTQSTIQERYNPFLPRDRDLFLLVFARDRLAPSSGQIDQ